MEQHRVSVKPMQLVATKTSAEIVCMSKTTLLHSLHHLIAGQIQVVMILGENHGCGLHNNQYLQEKSCAIVRTETT